MFAERQESKERVGNELKNLISALSIMVYTVTAAALFGGTAIGSAQAQSFQPAIVFDMGGKFDKSFNEAAYVG